MKPHRLGALGFLATDDKAAAGNYGIQDQIMVLKWVQKNIEKFGGDANKVTIMGEDAGAASVTILAMSPLANDLFHGAITLSGTYSYTRLYILGWMTEAFLIGTIHILWRFSKICYPYIIFKIIRLDLQ